MERSNAPAIKIRYQRKSMTKVPKVKIEPDAEPEGIAWPNSKIGHGLAQTQPAWPVQSDRILKTEIKYTVEQKHDPGQEKRPGGLRRHAPKAMPSRIVDSAFGGSDSGVRAGFGTRPNDYKFISAGLDTETEEPTVFEARVTQLLHTDRFLAAKPEDRCNVAHRIVGMVNLNVMNHSTRMSTRRIMKLEDFSVSSIVEFLIVTRYRSFSVQSVRDIVRNCNKPLVTIPGTFRSPTQEEEAQHAQVHYDATRRKTSAVDIPTERLSLYVPVSTCETSPIPSNPVPLPPITTIDSELQDIAPVTYTIPDSTQNPSWEPEPADRRLIAYRLVALANMNALEEHKSLASAKDLIFQLADKKFNMEEVLRFLEQRGYRYSRDAIRLIMEEPRTAVLALNGALSGQIVVAPGEPMKRKRRREIEWEIKKMVEEQKRKDEESGRDQLVHKLGLNEALDMEHHARVTEILGKVEEKEGEQNGG